MAKVMTVEDSGLIRSIIKKSLVEEGHEVIEVASGKDAILKYETEKPDLVFMDINLPGISGIEATKEILRFDPQARVVMCTILESENYKKDALETGAKDYLVKPFSKDEIVEAVTRNLRD